MKKDKSDIEFIIEILEGNQVAFENLYNKYKRLYMSICLRYFSRRTDAEDMLQESVLNIYKGLSSFDIEKGGFVTWSKRIVVNTCLQKLRKPGVLNFFDNILELGKRLPVFSNALEDLNMQDLTKIIQSLPKGYRTVFNLYVIDGYTHVEIAEKLSISVSTSKTQLMKAKKILKTRVGDEMIIFEHTYA